MQTIWQDLRYGARMLLKQQSRLVDGSYERGADSVRFRCQTNCGRGTVSRIAVLP